MQTIEAINHLKKKFGMRNRVAITDFDRKSFNRVIEHYNATMKQNSSNQSMFKKLFINEFLRQAVFYKKGTRLALTNIEDLLMQSMDSYYKVFADEVRFKKMQEDLIKIGYTEDYELSKDMIERALQLEENDDLLDANFDDLKDILLNGYTAEQAKSFLENHIHEIILTYKDFQ